MNDRLPGVVCDAGPLIHLDELGCLSLLNDFKEVLIPDQVWAEVLKHRPDEFSASDAAFARVAIEFSSKPTYSALVKTLSLDLGEQAALSLMEAHPDNIFLTDDGAARLAADALGYKVHGTIGLVVRAIRRNQRSRDEVVEILRAVPARSTLHVRPSILQSVLEKL